MTTTETSAPTLEKPGETGTESPIVLRDLHKSFGSQKVLNGINLTLGRGETLAVLGRSGTGKSVLLKLIVGLEKPDSGTIAIQGKDIAPLKLDQINEVRRKMGFLFQQAALYDSLTVEENVAFPMRHNSRMSESERQEKVRQLLESVGMPRDSQKMPADISGGMQKRVGLARALALNPEILLLDEPTAGLDPITSGEIDQLVLKLQGERHMTTVVVTHDLLSAKTITTRLALLNEGNIAIEGSFEDLEKSNDKFVSDFMKRDS